MKALLHGPLVLLVVQAFVVIALSRLIGLGARALRQPLVIAEIVAGIALGPSLLGWLTPSVSADLFPKSSMGTLGLLSQLGLILFMFLVGLEFDPKLLRGRAHTSVAISHTSIIVPFLLGALAALYLYPRLSDPSVSYTSFTLFMGVAMSITAFPVLARILVERRLMQTRVGAITIACAAVDDVTAWCILAFVVAIARFTGVSGAILTTVLALVYIAVMLVVVRPLLRRLADRARTREGLSQNLVAVVLLLVLLSAWATELIGIHALFGAFILGAIIPKTEGLPQLLADKLEDLVVVLLLPLFFAYSGLRTQIGLLSGAGDWVICGLIIVIACVGKFGGSVVAARLTGMRWREASALGVLMNTRGLMELIVLNIGLDLGVISPKLFTMMVLMALVTTFATSPLLEWIYPTSTQTQDIVERAESAPEPQSKPVEAFTILVCVAYEASGPAMLNVVAPLAASRVYALQLVSPADRASFILSQQAEQSSPSWDAPAPLTPLLERAKELELEVRPLSFVSAQPARDICSVAAAKRADLVIIGWHKPVFGAGILGGIVGDVLRGAHADVGVLIDRGLSEIRRVLVPYLGSVHDRAAVQIARRFAMRGGVEITLLHVVTPERKLRSEVESQMTESVESGPAGPVRIALKLVEHAKPVEAALEESRQGYDLVIVGVGSEWGLEQRVFGMMPEEIVERCPTSLLVVRDYAAPVARAVIADETQRTAALMSST
jgi:Kef-type K+ transport system membrane component KefB/nucleotide-binding universal stress UspA family protein